ncbi:hypothetical protein [Glycomyces terrestris]|uniref:Uncharacterized protein n=1 Tax=Glycomyces terrestris TaxID=2493553 RepID=A0A426UVI3_9ACTN|nr:hypothetical protein [Glycomyces terrestris]RRR98332.1 hypothetical protein EIW28_15625 [Glycomyces terrestris]
MEVVLPHHPLEEYAALVRPVVDRLHVGVRLASRPAVQELYAPLGLVPGLEMNLVYALLARPVPEAVVAERMVYLPFDAAEQEARGLVERAEGCWRFTPAGRGLAEAVAGALGAAAERLWSWRPNPGLAGLGAVEAALPLVARLVEAGRVSGGPVFAAFAPSWEPAGTPGPGALVARLEALRHHRADAHRAAWRGAGLTAAGIEAMAPGVERDAIEAETNRRDAPVYEALDARERLVLLAALGALGDGLDPARG